MTQKEIELNLCKKDFMSAAAYYPALIEHDYFIGIDNGVDSLSYYNFCDTCQLFTERFTD